MPQPMAAPPVIGGCFTEYLAPCSKGDMEASPGKHLSRLESEDWDVQGGPDIATPASVGLREPYPGLSRWLESALRPFVAEAERVRLQLQKCEARVQELEGRGAAPGRAAQGPLQSDGVSSQELRRQLREEVSQPTDIYQAVAVLEMQVQKVMDSMSEVEATQTCIKADVDEIREEMKGFEPNDLDFGAPIGKTLNTQDYAQMQAELRAELNRCHERLDDLTPRVYNQDSGQSQENRSNNASNDNRYDDPATKGSAAGTRYDGGSL